MRFHLISKHGILEVVDGKTSETSFNSRQLTIQQAFQICTKWTRNSAEYKTAARSLGIFIAEDLRPYSVIENEGFQHLMKTIQPELTTELEISTDFEGYLSHLLTLFTNVNTYH